MDPQEVVTYWILCFVSLFAVVNPLRASMTLASISEMWTTKQRATATNRAILISAAILFVGAWIGNHLILRSQINLGGFRIASGLLLLATVIPRMVRDRPLDEGFGEHAGLDGGKARALGLVPLAVPIVCNPASVATAVLYSGEPHELWRRLVNLLALGMTLVLTYFMMRLAPRVRRLFGERGARFCSHMMDLSVAAWAVDFIAVGVRDLLPLVTSTPPAGA